MAGCGVETDKIMPVNDDVRAISVLAYAKFVLITFVESYMVYVVCM